MPVGGVKLSHAFYSLVMNLVTQVWHADYASLAQDRR